MKWIKENKEKIYDKTNFVIEFFVALVLAIAIFKIETRKVQFCYISRLNTGISIISGLMIIGIIILNCIKYKDNLPKLFVTFVIPIGMLYAIINPIGNVPDEEAHIFRAYDFSCGNFITPLGEKNEGEIFVPEQMLKIAQNTNKFAINRELLSQEADYQNIVSVDTITKTYFPINYMTGALGFFIGRTFNINIIAICYAIRVINFALFVIIGYLSIKIIPFGKLLLSIYMFLPMILQQAASLSADSFINTIAIFFIAYNLKLLSQEKDLSLKQSLIYYVLSVSLALCKYAYFPLTFMSLLLIKNKNLSKAKRNQLIIISIVISIISAVGWFVFSQQYVDLRLYIKQANVQAIEQLKGILKDPIRYVNVFMNTIEQRGDSYLLTFIGSDLGVLNIKTATIYILIMLFGLCILPFLEENEKSLEKLQKLLMVIVTIILIGLIVTGLYLTWSPLGADIVAGVQGRYFIPVFILTLLAVIKKNNNVKINNIQLKYFIIYLVFNIIPIINLIKFCVNK